METDSLKLRTLTAAVLSVVLIEMGGSYLSDIQGISKLSLLCGIRILDIVVLIGLVLGFENSLSAVGIDFSRFLFGMKRGALWSMGFGVAAGVCGLALLSFGVNPLHLLKTTLPASVLDIALFFFVGGIIAPVAEELLFRGIIYRFLRRWGFLFALVISTAVFASLHLLSTGIPVTQMVGGILFAIAFEVEKNLLAPVVIHILGNLTLFSMSLIIT